MRIKLTIACLVFVVGAAGAADVESIFLSEIFYRPGGSSPPPFVEIYNASTSNESLKGWRVKIYTSRGTEQDYLPEDAVIPAHGFFLIGRKGDEGKWSNYNYKPDYYSEALSFQFLADRGGVILVKPNGETRDTAGWGTAPAPFYEKTPHETVGEGHSLERKSGPIHQETQGNSYDTDNNYNDLRERSLPEPQNILSPRENPSANTGEQAWGRIKAMYYGQK